MAFICVVQMVMTTYVETTGFRSGPMDPHRAQYVVTFFFFSKIQESLLARQNIHGNIHGAVFLLLRMWLKNNKGTGTFFVHSTKKR